MKQLQTKHILPSRFCSCDCFSSCLSSLFLLVSLTLSGAVYVLLTCCFRLCPSWSSFLVVLFSSLWLCLLRVLLSRFHAFLSFLGPEFSLLCCFFGVLLSPLWCFLGVLFSPLVLPFWCASLALFVLSWGAVLLPLG